MNLEKGFLGGFLVLGFALFVIGFLTGMLAFGLTQVTPEFANMGVLIFMLGFMAGMVTIALTVVMIKLNRLQKPS